MFSILNTSCSVWNLLKTLLHKPCFIFHEILQEINPQKFNRTWKANYQSQTGGLALFWFLICAGFISSVNVSVEKQKEIVGESADRSSKKKIERQEERLKNNNRDLSLVSWNILFIWEKHYIFCWFIREISRLWCDQNCAYLKTYCQWVLRNQGLNFDKD